MGDPERLRMGFIGSGIMARSHMREMIRRDLAEVVAVCEPSGDAYAATVELFASSGATPPANEPDWRRFVSAYADRLDAVFIVRPTRSTSSRPRPVSRPASTSCSRSRWS